MKTAVLYIIIFLILTGCGPKTEKLTHPDSAFRYRTRFERINSSTERSLKQYLESLPEEELKDPANKNLHVQFHKSFNVSMEVYFYISDPYTYVNLNDSIVDHIDVPPLFLGESAEHFTQWVAKKNDFKFPTPVINSAYRGSIIWEVYIDKNGNLSLVTLVNNDPLNSEMYNSITATLLSSPQWTPGRHEGEPAVTKYIMGVVWGHYRVNNKRGRMIFGGAYW